MLPVRWIFPIVGVLFALALIPMVFDPPNPSMRKVDNTRNERSERPQAIVPAGVQSNAPVGIEGNNNELKPAPDRGAVAARKDTANVTADIASPSTVNANTDMTGSVPAAPAKILTANALAIESPAAAASETKAPAKPARHVSRRFRVAAIQRAKGRTSYYGQRAWHVPPQDFKFNAN
jgi:hypothetical protein